MASCFFSTRRAKNAEEPQTFVSFFADTSSVFRTTEHNLYQECYTLTPTNVGETMTAVCCVKEGDFVRSESSRRSLNQGGLHENQS